MKQDPRDGFADSGVPLRHRQAVEAQFDPKVVAKVKEGLFERHGLVALVGPRGTGKTLLAAHAVRHSLFKHAREAKYIRAADMFARMRAEMDESKAGLMLAQLSRVWLLVIDELQEAFGTAWEDKQLVRLLDKRYGEMQPTLLIANLRPEAMVKALGASIVDRMMETGGLVEMTGPSHRRAATEGKA